MNHPIAFSALFLAGCVVGFAFTLKLALRKFHRLTVKSSRIAAMRLSQVYGNPIIQRAMGERFRRGHRFDIDPEFQGEIEQTILRSFNLLPPRTPRA
jgi:hypothetical protein